MSIEATAVKIRLSKAISDFAEATSELPSDQAVLAKATKDALETFEAEILNIAKRLG